MTPFEFLQRLSAIIPLPASTAIASQGVLAPHCKLRGKVIESAAPPDVLASQLQEAAARMGIGTEQQTDETKSVGEKASLEEADNSAGQSPTSSTLNKSAWARHLSMMWAMLIARIYEALPLLCPKCGQPMKIISFITEPDTISKILRHLGEPTEPPAITPARAPSQCDLELYEHEPA